MSSNITILQGFEWFTENDGQHWKRLISQIENLKKIGIKMVWMPPATKGSQGINDVGYSVYDRYDLGEFDQKGDCRTKYGTKDDYIHCIEEFHKHNIQVLADIVLNQMDGADEAEPVELIPYDKEKRDKNGNMPVFEAQAYTKFTYSNRDGKYSTDSWNQSDFNSVDYIQNPVFKNESDREALTGKITKKELIYLFNGKKWNTETDWGKLDRGIRNNFDYLMCSNVDFHNLETREKLKQWGKWYLETTGVDGFRLDAIKHISYDYMPEWVDTMRRKSGSKLFVVGEYVTDERNRLVKYLDEVISEYRLFDFTLHYALQKASENSNQDFDMSTVFADSLLYSRPKSAVTFVDNHDTQEGAGPLASEVGHWFKRQAYALILFQKEGIPCIFFRDLFGHHGIDNSEVDGLAQMCYIRRSCAHGLQTNYYDDRDCIGYTRAGTGRAGGYPFSGMAIMVCNNGRDDQEQIKYMYVNTKLARKKFVNIYDTSVEDIELDPYGCANFKIKGANVGIWILREAYDKFIKDPYYNWNPKQCWDRVVY